MRLDRDDCTACSSNTSFPKVQGLLHPKCDVAFSILGGLGSDTQIRGVDQSAPDEADDNPRDSCPKVCPVALIP
jgi:hypothetical protein